jgi:hypothetical protein
MNTAEPLVPELSVFEDDLVIEKLKRHKPPCIDQIPAEFIKAGIRKIHYKIHKMIISFWNKKELPEERKDLFIIPMYNQGDNTDRSNQTGISLLSTTSKIVSNILLSRLTAYAVEIIWGISMCISTQQVNY